MQLFPSGPGPVTGGLPNRSIWLCEQPVNKKCYIHELTKSADCTMYIYKQHVDATCKRKQVFNILINITVR